mgnify:CR=1 FL=1
MSQITCTRRLTFCAGHRVLGHENKCAHLHGHNYVVEVTARSADTVDELGRVIDFSVIKAMLGNWLDTNFDHGFILHEQDTANIEYLSNLIVRPEENFAHLQLAPVRQKLFVLPVNPTAENIAHYLLHTVCPLLFGSSGVQIIKVRVHETENCYADAEL